MGNGLRERRNRHLRGQPLDLLEDQVGIHKTVNRLQLDVDAVNPMQEIRLADSIWIFSQAHLLLVMLRHENGWRDVELEVASLAHLLGLRRKVLRPSLDAVA